MCNEKIELKQVSVEQSVFSQNRAELLGYSNSSTISSTNMKLNLSVPGKGVTSIEAAHQFLEDPLYSTWINCLVKPAQLLSRKRKQAPVPNLPTLPRRPALCPGNEPTVLFATVTNAGEDIISMDIDRNASQVVTGGRDSIVRVWRLDNTSGNKFGENLDNAKGGFTETMPKQKPNNPLQRGLSLQGASFGKSVADGGSSNSNNSSSGFPLLELKGHHKPVYGVSQDATLRLILSASADEHVRLWDTTLSQCIGKYRTLSTSWDVSFGPLGHYFITAHQDSTACLFATDRGAPLRMMVGHTSDVTTCQWHPNNSLFLTGSDDRSGRLWDIRTGSAVRLFDGCVSGVSSVCVSRDGRYAALGCETGSIHVWDIAASKQLGSLRGSSGSVLSSSFSECGGYLSAGGFDCAVRVWEISTLSSDTNSEAIGNSKIIYPMKSFPTKFSGVYFVDYSPQNMIIAGGPFCLESKE